LHLSTTPAEQPPSAQTHFQGQSPSSLALGVRERETLGMRLPWGQRKVAVVERWPLMGGRGCNIMAVAVCGEKANVGVNIWTTY